MSVASCALPFLATAKTKLPRPFQHETNLCRAMLTVCPHAPCNMSKPLFTHINCFSPVQFSIGLQRVGSTNNCQQFVKRMSDCVAMLSCLCIPVDLSIGLQGVSSATVCLFAGNVGITPHSSVTSHCCAFACSCYDVCQLRPWSDSICGV